MELLSRRAAVVTGAASGIGKAITAAFVEAGASVMLCDINRDAVEATAQKFADRAIGRVTDVSDEDQVEAAMHATRDAFGSLDIVVNCAGFGAITPLIELSGNKWRAVQAVTLNGVFYGVKHGARVMLEQGHGGVIINISSVNGRQPGEGQAAYCAAKAGVDMLTRCGALELGGRGIRVVGIAPGLVETPLTRHELEDPSMRELFLGVIPMRRAVEAREIAAAAVFLASDCGGAINGETIAIDGGSLTKGYPALLTGLKKAVVMIDVSRYTSGRIAIANLSATIDGLESRRARGAESDELFALSRALVREGRPAGPHRGPRPRRDHSSRSHRLAS